MVVRHLEQRWHSTSPTATGLMPPCFLMAAKRLAPQKKGATCSGMLPALILLRTPVSAARHANPRSWPRPMTSLRCSALRPEGPGAEPALKCLTDWNTSFAERMAGPLSGSPSDS